MNENICRFGFSGSADLICERFVLETKNSQRTARTADGHFIHLIISGKAVLHADGLSREIAEGEVFFVHKDQSYAIEAAEGSAYGYVRFGGRRANELIQRLGVTPRNCIFTPAVDVRELWKQAFLAASEKNTDLISEAVLLYTVANLTPALNKKSSLITQLLTITSERFADKRFSLSKLASEINYDTKYLSTVFKKEKGIGYREYLRELRVNHACFLMEQGVVSVKNVALLSGFSDALYFSKVFKLLKGLTPSEYIERFQKEAE